MKHSEDNRQLDDVVAEITAELREGTCPGVREICDRYPHLADEIRDIFPAIVSLELAHPSVTNSSDPSSAATELPIRAELGDFVIVREIGRGGMAIVYEAQQQSLGRRVALKVLTPPMLHDPRQVQRFEREARAAAQLHHSNIVPVLGVGQDHDVHYLVMQLIQGAALDEILQVLREPDPPDDQETNVAWIIASRLRAGQLVSDSAVVPERGSSPANHATRNAALPPQPSSPASHRYGYWRSLASIGLQAAEALAYADHQGIVHRDIKPSNLLIDRDGTTWIADFGLAKAIDSVELTMSGELVGTLRYLPPERLRGEADVRGDIYGLGATLYELAVGRPPFDDEDNAKLLRRIAEEDPPRPRSLVRTIPRDLETIIVKAMAKEPRDRYKTPDDLAGDLRLFLEDLPINARRTAAAERCWRWCRRRPAVAIPSLVAILLALFTTVGSVLVAARLERERNVAQDAERRALQSERARREELFRAHIANSRNAVATNWKGQRLDGLRALQDAMTVLPAEERSAEQDAALIETAIACLARADVREDLRIPLVSAHYGAIAIDPAFESFAQPVEGGAGTQVVSLTDPEKARVFAPAKPGMSGFHGSRQFSPSGQWLAEVFVATNSGEPWRLRIWSRASGQIALETSIMPPLAGGLAFRPDDRRVAVLGQNQVMQVFDLETGHQVSRSPRRYGGAKLSYSADGRYLAVAPPNLPVEIVDAESWELIHRLTELDVATAVAFDPQDARTLIIGGRNWVASWNMTSGHVTPLGGFAERTVNEILIGEDGRIAALADLNAVQLRTRDDDDSLVWLNCRIVGLSADGRRLAMVENERELVIGTLIMSRSVRRVNAAADSIAFSSDQRFAALSGSHGVSIYSADTLTCLADLGLDHCGRVAFAPDRSALVTCGLFTQACLWPMNEEQCTIGPPRSLCTPTMPQFHTGTLSPQRYGRDAEFAPDGRLYFADYRNNRILTWDDLKEAPREFAAMHGVTRVVVHPQGRWIAGTATGMPIGRVWDARDGHLILEVPEAQTAAFSTEGRYLAFAAQFKVLIYETSHWKLVHQIELGGSNMLAMQPGGRLLAVAGPRHRVQLYDVATAKHIAQLPPAEGATINDMTFSPDGRRLAIVQRDSALTIWDFAILERELADLGLSVPEGPLTLTEVRNLAESVRQIVVDRGSLPPADEWFQCWHRLALNEATRGEWPDALENIQKAINTLPAGREVELAMLLAERGTYQCRNDEPDAARSSWEESLRVDLGSGEAARRLVRFHVLGPAEIRSKDRAALLLGFLHTHSTSVQEQKVLRGLIDIRYGLFSKGLEGLASVEVPPDWRIEVAYFVALARHGLDESEKADVALAEAVAMHEAEERTLNIDRRRDLQRLREEVEPLVRRDRRGAAPSASE